jgi:hypothetical protein
VDIRLGVVCVVAVAAVVARTVAARWRPSRRSAVAAGPATLPDVDAALTRLEVSIEAIALEVERLGENQRYLTRVLGERASGSETLPLA